MASKADWFLCRYEGTDPHLWTNVAVRLAHELKRALATYTESGGTGRTALHQEAVALMQQNYEASRDLRLGEGPFHIVTMAKPKKAPDYRQLSIAERLRLVEDIWDSIAKDTRTVPVPSEVLDEAERRLAEHREDPNSAIPWDEVKAELYKRGE